MIDYVLEDNFLTPDENDRRARVVNVRSYSEEDLAEAIARRNIGISKSEALAMLEAEADIQLEWISEGNAINRRLEHFHPAVPGAYREGEYPRKAVIRITASKELNEAAKKITLRQVEPVSQMRIDFVNDVKSSTTNEKITSGSVVKITGHNLKVSGNDPSVGIAFLSITYPNTVYAVPVIDVVQNNPSELIIIAPTMNSTEEVQIRVITQFSGGTKDLKAPRSITFERKLTVV
jgi:hypothetical protein